MLTYSPLSHLIAFGLLAWLSVMFNRVTAPGEQKGAKVAVIGVLFLWVLASSRIAYSGYYLSLNENYLLIVVGTAMPLILVAILALVSKPVRTLLDLFINRMSFEALSWVHIVRIAALGTIYKWHLGELPSHFILPVAIPDFLIGLSAYFISRRVVRKGPDRLFVGWNTPSWKNEHAPSQR